MMETQSTATESRSLNQANREPVYAKIGSISHGTLRTEDLLGAFSYTLERLAKREVPPNYVALKLVREAEEHLKLEEPTDEQIVAAMDLVADLEDALQDYAPAYCYFGTLQGDASEFGFWIDWDSLENDCVGKWAAVLRIDAGDPWPDDRDFDFVLEVNDHGNAALYNARTQEEIWSVV